MNKVCLECGHFNEEYEGGAFETCPKCGALYGKTTTPQKPAVETSSEVPQRSNRKAVNNPNMTVCEDCGETISKNAKACPHCGAHIKRRNALSPADSLASSIQTAILAPVIMIGSYMLFDIDFSTALFIGVGFVVIAALVDVFAKR